MTDKLIFEGRILEYIHRKLSLKRFRAPAFPDKFTPRERAIKRDIIGAVIGFL